MYLPLVSNDEVVAELLSAAGSGEPPLWLLCVADRHGGEVAGLLAALGRHGVRACGGIFPGLIHGALRKDHGLLAIKLPPGSRVLLADLAADGVRWRDPLPPPLPPGKQSSVIIVDCLAPSITALLEDVYDRYGYLVHHVGAGAGYHDLRREPPLFTTDGMYAQAALLILIPQQASVRVRHGWKRVAGPFVASRTSGNVIQELNWESAGAFYRRQVTGQDASNADRPVFPDLNSRYPLCISKEGCEDVIRDPMQINDADEIVVLSDVRENSVMYLAHADRESLIEAARLAVEDCGTPADVERCFISDCYSRALALGDDFFRELLAVQRVLTRFTRTTPEGVLALGEIAANGERSIEFFNKTFVIAVSYRCRDG